MGIISRGQVSIGGLLEVRDIWQLEKVGQLYPDFRHGIRPGFFCALNDGPHPGEHRVTSEQQHSMLSRSHVPHGTEPEVTWISQGIGLGRSEAAITIPWLQRHAKQEEGQHYNARPALLKWPCVDQPIWPGMNVSRGLQMENTCGRKRNTGLHARVAHKLFLQ